jgi:CRP-like cAMP-binding protein
MRELSIGVLDDLSPTLGPDQVEQFRARATLLSFAKGELIYRQGEPAEYIFLLLEGEAQSTLLNSSGNEMILRIHLPGSILGLTALASVPWRDASAKAIGPSRLARIATANLKALVRNDSVLALGLIQLLVDRMSDFHFRVGDLQAQTVERRLARVLLAIARRPADAGRPGGKPEIHLTHEELAQLVNSRRQTVTAILGRFAQAGYIAKAGRRFVIEDARGLRDLMP